MTYTVVELPVSKAAYEEIAKKLRDAGYDHVFHEEDGKEMIDMTHIALVAEEEPTVVDMSIFMNIFVNGKQHPFDVNGLNGDRISYETVLRLAGYDPTRILSVTYFAPKKGDVHRDGCMCKGGVIRVEEGMRFDVCNTSNA